MKEPMDIQQATLRGSLILAIVTVLAASWVVWWGQHLAPLPTVSPQAIPQAKNGGAMAIDAVYLEPHRVLWATPQGVVLVPLAFALEFNRIVECESQWDTKAIGDAGERGLAQVHPIHDRQMERMGLDPAIERDRIVMSVALWRARGWQPWSCSDEEH